MRIGIRVSGNNRSMLGTGYTICCGVLTETPQGEFGSCFLCVDYLFGGAEPDRIKEDGEWVRKLYVDQGSPEIPCFDIELGENYRDGTRGNTDPKVFDGRYKMYEADKVANRHQKGLPFYTKDASGVISGRFAIVSLQEPHMILSDKTLLSKTIPFYEFLEKYFKERDNWKFPDEEKK